MMVFFAQQNAHPSNFSNKKVNFNHHLHLTKKVNNTFDFSKLYPLRIELGMLQTNNNNLFLPDKNKKIDFSKIIKKKKSACVDSSNFEPNFYNQNANCKTLVDSYHHEGEYSYQMKNSDNIQSTHRLRITNNSNIKEPRLQFYSKRHSVNFIKLNIIKIKKCSYTPKNLINNIYQKSSKNEKGKVIILNSNWIKNINHKDLSLKTETTKFNSLSNSLHKTQIQKRSFSNEVVNSEKSLKPQFLLKGEKMTTKHKPNMLHHRPYSSIYSNNFVKNNFFHTVSTQFSTNDSKETNFKNFINNDEKKINTRIYKGLSKNFQRKKFSLSGV